MPPDSSRQHPGKLICALALVSVGKLIFDRDSSPSKCNRSSTSVHMVEVCDNRGGMGPPNGGKMEGKHEQSPDFCGFALQREVFLALTFMKAALFTAIVTSFVLDTMSDLDEDTATELLRLIAEQSAGNSNSTIEMPPSNPPSSILTVSSLWFLSIMSSLAATIWAVLCLEWCTSFSGGFQADDYERMAEERQRNFEALKRWRVHIVFAAIPFLLHVSLFLFLAGLWLRVRDVNEQLGLIVGVPSLIIVSSYVLATLLPIFTHAPCSSSASELIEPIIDGIRLIFELGRFIRPPLFFLWIGQVMQHGRVIHPIRDSLRIPRIFLVGRFLRVLERIRMIAGLYAHIAWEIFALLPIIPTFELDRNPFSELKELNAERSDRDKDEGIYLRALFWLMDTPLNGNEVKEIFEEFKSRGNAGVPLDRAVIRLLALSLSSILEDDYVSDDEWPTFSNCTSFLAEQMDRAFRDGELHFPNTTISKKLAPHFPLDASGNDYWSRAVSSLWLCPSEEMVRNVVKKLDLDIQSTEASAHCSRAPRGDIRMSRPRRIYPQSYP